MISRRGGGSDFVFGPREVKVPKIDSDFVRLAGSDRAANATADDRALVPIDVELLVLEQFPPELRRALNKSATKLNSLAFVDHYNWAVRQGLGAQRTLRRLAEIERNELEVFAGKYKAECQGRLGRDEFFRTWGRRRRSNGTARSARVRIHRAAWGRRFSGRGRKRAFAHRWRP